MADRSILINREIPLTAVIPIDKVELLSIRPCFKYDENRRKTEEIVGFSYIVGENISYKRLNIKVMQKYPLIDPDELKRRKDANERFFVRFINPTIKMYWNPSQENYADSFKADGIEMCSNISAVNSDISDEDLGLD